VFGLNPFKQCPVLRGVAHKTHLTGCQWLARQIFGGVEFRVGSEGRRKPGRVYVGGIVIRLLEWAQVHLGVLGQPLVKKRSPRLWRSNQKEIQSRFHHPLNKEIMTKPWRRRM